jgi:Transcription termination factor nusG
MLMANEKTGNLAQVRQALRKTGLQVGDIVDHDGSSGINAEMAAGISPAWYLIEVIPGQERVAAAHLSGRRFGIFIPDMRYRPMAAWDATTRIATIVRGEKLDRLQRMFVGYIFVFTWLDRDGKNWGRIHAIPGVRRIVCWPESGVAVISDAKIGFLRSLETTLCPIEMPADWRKSKKRYGWRKEKQVASVAAPVEEKMFTTVKGWINVGDRWIDTIEALRVLDGRDENQSLTRALGLASQ